MKFLQKENVKYLIVLIAFFIGACGVVFLDDISDDCVDLNYPEDNLATKSMRIEFDWDELKGADSYRFQLVAPSFESNASILHDTILGGTRYEYKFSTTGQYQWRVCGKNDEYRSKYTTRTFTITNSK
jgi:hypothetical protein